MFKSQQQENLDAEYVKNNHIYATEIFVLFHKRKHFVFLDHSELPLQEEDEEGSY
jgi:hypothetical protein